MQSFFSFIVALFLTVLLVPVAMRFAASVGLVDRPDTDRKVHRTAIPRCGGIAMVAAAIVPLIMWLPLDRDSISLLLAILVIAFFGVWDDRIDLDYRIKLFGQSLAIIIVMSGGTILWHLPLFGMEPVPAYLAYPVTFIFLLGVTNAVNLADGLDGLAGGCALLTLGMIALLAYLATDRSAAMPLLVLTLAAMGSILGFLRFNTHPAVVFMGDTGSQFLGLVAGIATIRLTEGVHGSVSAMLPFLLLGMPILDTGWVMAQRILSGRSPFSADRNHIHHKLLSLGFYHHEVVALIYAAHAALISTAFFLRYQSDLLLLIIYLGFCGTVIGLYYWAKATGWQVRQERSSRPGQEIMLANALSVWLKQRAPAIETTFPVLAGGVLLFLALGAFCPPSISFDLGLLAGSVAILFTVYWLVFPQLQPLPQRIAVYTAILTGSYLLAVLADTSWLRLSWLNLYCVGLLLLLLLAIRLGHERRFRASPQDFLVLFFAIAVPNIADELFASFPVAELTFHVVVLFYVSEFLMSERERGRTERLSGMILSAGVVGFLSIVALRGLATV